MVMDLPPLQPPRGAAGDMPLCPLDLELSLLQLGRHRAARAKPEANGEAFDQPSQSPGSRSTSSRASGQATPVSH